MANEALNSNGEATIFFIWHNFSLLSEYVLLYTKISVALTPYQISFFFAAQGTIREIHNCQNAENT